MSPPLAFLYSPFIVVKLKYSHSSFQLIDRPRIIILTKFVLATIKGEESKLRERLTACMGASTSKCYQCTKPTHKVPDQFIILTRLNYAKEICKIISEV